MRNKIAITGYLQVNGRKALCVPKAMGKNTAELVLEDYTIVKIESGENPNPTIETLMKIAKVLNVNVSDLIK